MECSDSPPLAPTDLDRLDIAEHQWAARGYTNYSIDMVHLCDCPPSFRDRARIEVIGGTVQKVTLLGTLAVITDSRKLRYRTVEDVFRDIRDANAQGNWQRVTFSLDPVVGLPTYVHWTAKTSVPELELILQISNPQPLSSLPLPH
jgi:hypothetical protein